MADRVSVSIRIGGAIPRRQVKALANTIELERLSIDWDENPFDPAQLSLGRPLDLCAHEVAWGRLDDLEEFCVSQGLPFVRWSGGCAGSFGPERVVFDGQGDPRIFAVTEDDEVVINLDTIRRLGSMEAIETHFAAANFTVPPLTVRGGRKAGRKQNG